MENSKENENLVATVVKVPGVGPKTSIATDADNQPLENNSDEPNASELEQKLLETTV